MTRAPAKNPRPRCPACNHPMQALVVRVGEKGVPTKYEDPKDHASVHACPEHGRVAIFPDGTMRLEAKQGIAVEPWPTGRPPNPPKFKKRGAWT